MALDLAPRLRPADRDELLANGRCPTAGLLRCATLSTLLRAITVDGRPIALFGFAHCDVETACPWLLASEELTTTHRAWFIRHSAEIVSTADTWWNHFVNRVDARNALHVRWLRWAGFTVDPAVPHGPHGLLFHPFHRTSPCAT